MSTSNGENKIPREVGAGSKKETAAAPKDTEGTTAGSEKHAIETATVGLPGVEQHEVAYTIAGDQVEVRPFKMSDVIGVKRTNVEENEEEAVETLDGKTPEEQENIAKRAIASSKVETEDIKEVAQLFENKRDRLYVVESATLRDDLISKEGLHLLVLKSDMTEILQRLQGLGYATQDIGDRGVEVKKGQSRFVFHYAKEKVNEEPNEEDPGSAEKGNSDEVNSGGKTPEKPE